MPTSRRTSSITYFGCAAAVIAAFSYSCSVALAFSPTFVVLSSGRTVPSRLFAGGEGGEETAQQHPPAAALPSEKETDILNSPAFLKRKLEVLKSDIAKMDEKISKVKADLEAGKAQWEGKFKELERERTTVQERLRDMYQNEDKLASVDIARAMLEVLDNFERAFKNVIPETTEQKEMEAAYKHIFEQIQTSFHNLGIREIETVGKEFDYAVHQAVMSSPSDEYEEGFVIQELQKGYALDDTVIRAAYVVVAC